MNLRTSLGKRRWRKLRDTILAERGPACAICSGTGKPHAHEIWDYKETKKTGTAIVVGVEIICERCHQVHHYGNTKCLLEEGRITPKEFREIEKHFLKVNGCTEQVLKAHVNESFDGWEIRSAKKWKIDFGPFADAVREAQEARQRRAASLAHKTPDP